MDYRVGTCSSCKAQFRVPATFTAAKAKCKKCDGVVVLGPVQGASPEAVAAPAAKLAAPERPQAARPPRPEPERPAAAQPKPSPAPAKPPAAKPPTKARLEPQAERPAAPAARPAPPKDSVRKAAEAAAERVRSGGTEAPKSKPAAAGSGATARPSRARQRPAKKKSQAPMLVGLGALLALAAGGAWFLFGRGPAPSTQAAESESPALAEQTGEPVEALAVPAAPVEQVAESATGEPAAEGPGAPEETAADSAAPAPAASSEPAELPALVAFGKLSETSDDDWTQYQQLTATFIDPTAGAAGNRARGKLLAAGYQALPAVLNALLEVDLSTVQGNQDGGLLQTLLTEFCRGNNFDWKSSTDAKDQVFNRKVLAKWHTSWGQVVQERRAWINLGKLSEEEGVEFLAQVGAASAPAAESVGSSETLDDF